MSIPLALCISPQIAPCVSSRHVTLVWLGMRKTGLLLCKLFHRISRSSVVPGDRTLINIMGNMLEKYGKGEDLSAAPVDAMSVSPDLPCVAQFTEDGMWYRATVLKFVEDDKVEVNCLSLYQPSHN